MIEITAKEMMRDQKKRFCRLKQKEEENSITEYAKANFRRKPYMGMYRNHDAGNQDGECLTN